MFVRHLAVKGFDIGVSLSRYVIKDGVPYSICNKYSSIERSLGFNDCYPIEVNVVWSLSEGRRKLMESPIVDIIFRDGVPLTLCDVFKYRVTKDSSLVDFIPKGTTFRELVSSPVLRSFLVDVARCMFPNISPITCELDIDSDDYYTMYIPLVSVCGCLPPQLDGNGLAYFNAGGVVTVAEFLDGLNAIYYGSNSRKNIGVSTDGVSDEGDYFNMGYCTCAWGISSPFSGVYTRSELLEPITRLEMAYIIVNCWTVYSRKFSGYVSGLSDLLSRFNDGLNYQVSSIFKDTGKRVLSVDLKDYTGGRTITEFKESMYSGRSPIPLPMYKSLLELGVRGLFIFSDGTLSPFKEVSRGEFSYLLVGLADILSGEER